MRGCSSGAASSLAPGWPRSHQSARVPCGSGTSSRTSPLAYAPVLAGSSSAAARRAATAAASDVCAGSVRDVTRAAGGTAAADGSTRRGAAAGAAAVSAVSAAGSVTAVAAAAAVGPVGASAVGAPCLAGRRLRALRCPAAPAATAGCLRALGLQELWTRGEVVVSAVQAAGGSSGGERVGRARRRDWEPGRCLGPALTLLQAQRRRLAGRLRG